MRTRILRWQACTPVSSMEDHSPFLTPPPVGTEWRADRDNGRMDNAPAERAFRLVSYNLDDAQRRHCRRGRWTNSYSFRGRTTYNITPPIQIMSSWHMTPSAFMCVVPSPSTVVSSLKISGWGPAYRICNTPSCDTHIHGWPLPPHPPALPISVPLTCWNNGLFTCLQRTNAIFAPLHISLLLKTRGCSVGKRPLSRGDDSPPPVYATSVPADVLRCRRSRVDAAPPYPRHALAGLTLNTWRARKKSSPAPLATA